MILGERILIIAMVHWMEKLSDLITGSDYEYLEVIKKDLELSHSIKLEKITLRIAATQTPFNPMPLTCLINCSDPNNLDMGIGLLNP